MSVTVGELLDAYVLDRVPVVVQPQRIRDTVAHLSPVLGHLPLAQLTRRAVLDYTEGRLAEGVQPQTARRELVSLRAALRLAWRDGAIDRVPPIPMPPHSKRRERVLSREEIRALLSATAPRPRLHMFLRLLIATCARVSAVCELTWAKIDTGRRIIDLRSDSAKAGRMKGRAVVRITPKMVTHLLAYRDAPEAQQGRGRRPKPGARVVGLAVTTVRGQLKHAAALAGVEGVTPHVIRHSVATHLIAEGVPLAIVSKMLGHASVSITADVYGHLQPSHMDGAAEALDAWAGD